MLEVLAYGVCLASSGVYIEKFVPARIIHREMVNLQCSFTGVIIFCISLPWPSVTPVSGVRYIRYLMEKLLCGWKNVHPSNTDYISKNKFDQFQI